MEVSDSWIVWLVAAVTAAYLITFAYKQIKHQLKHKLVNCNFYAIFNSLLFINKNIGELDFVYFAAA